MVDVLVVYLNPVLHPYATPYGASIVLQKLRSTGIMSELIIPFLDHDPVNSFKESVQAHKPAIVALSFRNLDDAGCSPESNGEMHYVQVLKDFVTIARESETLCVLGGSGFSIAPENILQETGAELGFVGACEHEFAEFCSRYLKGISIREAISGLASSRVRNCQCPDVSSEVSFPLGQPIHYSPSVIEYVKLCAGVIPVRTKSGCSNACSYCVASHIESFQLRPWDDIKLELNNIIDQKLADRVFIADGEFNIPNEEYALSLCKKISASFADAIKWRCYLIPPHISSELMDSMREAGCVGVSLSVDSFDSHVLEGYAKKYTPDQAEATIRVCLNAGITPLVTLLFGGPNETFATIDRTIEKASQLIGLGAIFTVASGLRVYPNTGLNHISRQPEYAEFYAPLKSLPWLGTFSSPCPGAELHNYLIAKLPPSDNVIYCNMASNESKEFYSSLAYGAKLLCESRSEIAEAYFTKLASKYPESKEVRLGLLKCDVRKMRTDLSSKNDSRN